MFGRDSFGSSSPLFKLGTLIACILIGAIASSIIVLVVFRLIYGANANLINHIDALRGAQLVSSVFTFLLPAICVGWLCSNSVKNYLYISNTPSLNVTLLIFLSLLLLTPFITLTGYFNKMLQLPSFMMPIQQWMEAQESESEQLITKMLNGGSVVTILSNIVVIALGAAVTEEFLFRGALTRIIKSFTTNKHLVVWMGAFAFSAFHVQFFGFVPRLLLGAYFGYLLIWSKNIWIPVIAHFFNNGMAVVLMSTPSLKEQEVVSGDISDASLLPFTLFSLVSLYLFSLCLKRIKTFILP